MSRLLDDPFVAAEIEAVMAPYLAGLEGDEADWMRSHLASLMEDGGPLQSLLNGAHPRVVDRSGERVKPYEDQADETSEEGAG